MPSELKRAIAREIAADLEQHPDYLFVTFSGLDALEATGLRALLRERGLVMNIIKNRLYHKALELSSTAARAEAEALRSILRGPTALVYGEMGLVEVAKVLAEWRRKSGKLGIKGGVLEGRILSSEEAQALARIPDRPVLLGQVVGGFAAPVRGLVGVAAGLLRKLVYALRAIEQRGGGTDDAAATAG